MAGTLGGCAPDEGAVRQSVVHVPADASLSDAGSRVADGGLILIAPGVYTETLEVRGDDVTVRGEDRNAVVIDGGLVRSNGIVAVGERIAIENLTVRNHMQSGVLVTGLTDDSGAGVARGPDGYLPGDVPPPVPGYLVQFVTAENNGLYGIYAFNRTGGIIRDNQASGGSDSGIYVGQCAACNALVQDNVVGLNAVGIELANASEVALVGNRIVGNRVGISVLSNYLEAHGPSRGVQIAGNLVADNDEAATPVQAGGAFGVGIGLGGTVDAVVHANTIVGHDVVGLWVTSSEDFAPRGTEVTGNRWDGNAIDVAYVDRVGGSGNCFDLPEGAIVDPEGGSGCLTTSGNFSPPDAPAGIRFSDVDRLPERAGLLRVDETPRVVTDRVDMPDLSDVVPPASDLLEGG